MIDLATAVSVRIIDHQGERAPGIFPVRSWLDRYEEYMEEVEKCNEIKDVKKRGEALLKAEADFNLWMDIYPESEPFPMNLQIQKTHDEFMDKMGLNPKI